MQNFMFLALKMAQLWPIQILGYNSNSRLFGESQLCVDYFRPTGGATEKHLEHKISQFFYDQKMQNKILSLNI